MNFSGNLETVRRAKIVCTLGPATSTQERMEELMKAGLDVARFNMSHGDHSEHLVRLQETRAASKAVGKTIGLLADLQGPKIRLGVFAEGKVELSYGQNFTITVDDVLGDNQRASTTYKGLPGDVKVGDQILIDDATLRWRQLRLPTPTLLPRSPLRAQSATTRALTCRAPSLTSPR